MTKKQAAEQEEARVKLRGWLKPGDTVFTILRNVSRSGMSRDIDVVLIIKNDDGTTNVLHTNYLVHKAIGVPLNKDGDAVKMVGCGMDMGFALVYELSYALFGKDGWQCLGEHCPSADHSNGDRDYTPHTHTDGGYALKQRWL